MSSILRMKQVVCIGGLGGSGTRVVARILNEAGMYLGAELNPSVDNLVFTRLFRDPAWYQTASAESINYRLRIFDAHMTYGLTIPENASSWPTTADLRSLAGTTGRSCWGWKEPNSHIFLEHLLDYFPSLKYVHVVRHGLDMAFSSNMQQLKNWASLYEISSGADDQTLSAPRQLDYWIKANQLVLRKSQLIPDQIMFLRFEDLCDHARASIDHLLRWLQLEVAPQKRQQLYSIPRKPPTAGRFRSHDLSQFSAQQLAAVATLGYKT